MSHRRERGDLGGSFTGGVSGHFLAWSRLWNRTSGVPRLDLDFSFEVLKQAADAHVRPSQRTREADRVEGLVGSKDHCSVRRASVSCGVVRSKHHCLVEHGVSSAENGWRSFKA